MAEARNQIRRWGTVLLFLLFYLDDILCIHHNADTMLEWLHKSFPLKSGYGKPNMYLGDNLHETRLHNGVWAWAMSPKKNVQEAVRIWAVHLLLYFRNRLGLWAWSMNIARGLPVVRVSQMINQKNQNHNNYSHFWMLLDLKEFQGGLIIAWLFLI